MRTKQVDADVTGAAATFTSWVRPHWTSMDRLAVRLVGPGAAEDVVQDSLAAAWRSRHTFDPDRGQPRTWLLAIVANQARNHRRRRATLTLVTDELPAHPPPPDAGLDLTAALAQLTARRREAVALHYYLGLSVPESAAVMGCSEGTVKSTLSDARAQLREILGEEYR